MDKLFDGQGADGSSSTVSWHRGRLGQVIVSGTFGGGTVTLQQSPDGGTTWVSVGSDVEFTEDGMALFGPISVDSDTLLRLDLSGSTSPSIDGWVGVAV